MYNFNSVLDVLIVVIYLQPILGSYQGKIYHFHLMIISFSFHYLFVYSIIISFFNYQKYFF